MREAEHMMRPLDFFQLLATEAPMIPLIAPTNASVVAMTPASTDTAPETKNNNRLPRYDSPITSVEWSEYVTLLMRMNIADTMMKLMMPQLWATALCELDAILLACVRVGVVIVRSSESAKGGFSVTGISLQNTT